AYEFSGYLIVQSQGHQAAVLAAAFPPVVLLLVTDVARRRRSVPAGGILLGLSAAAALYTWEETLLATLMFAAIGVTAALVVAPAQLRAAWRAPAAAIAVAAVTGAALSAPGLWVQFFGPMHLGASALRPADIWVIDLQNLWTPTQQQLLAPSSAITASHSWTGDGFEWGGYLGLPLIAVVAAGAVMLRRRPVVRWLALMLVLGAVLSLGPVLHVGGRSTGVPLPWALLDRLPLIRDILAARLAVFPALAGAVLLAIAVDALLADRRTGLAFAATVVVLASLLPNPLPAQVVSVPAFFSSGVQRVPAGAVVLVAPYPTPAAAAAMSWQVASGMRFRMPGGYILTPDRSGGLVESSSNTATSVVMQQIEDGQTPAFSAALLAEVASDLQHLQVAAVVVGPMPHRADMVALFSTALAKPPSQVGGVDVWWIQGVGHIRG
ncbi:MAG TPA: hypothetical protein VFA70_09145, partial [Dehalococcoidia bacterium]|nr:hypothetical protein [Dehalococcoidia bacterium]